MVTNKFLIAAVAVALGACRASSSDPPVTAPPVRSAAPVRPDPLASAALIEHVRALSDPRLEGREAASDGEREAFRYIADQLRAIRLSPLEQAVPYKSGSRNLHVRVDGARANEVIIVGAHVDHLGRRDGVLYPGADDNAAGVAVVLGIAAALAERRSELGRSVVLVWFGAEEPGMIGSQHFIAEPPLPLAGVAVMLNVDMIGRPLVDQPLYRLGMSAIGIDAERSVGLFGARHYPGLRALADAAFAGNDIEIVAAEDLPEMIADEVERQSRGRGDSVPFEARGIPALFFGDGESSDYHKPTDTIDKLSPVLLERRARSLARVVIDLSRAPPTAFAHSDAVPARRKP